MINLIKTQLYSIRHDVYTYVTFGIVSAFTVAAFFILLSGAEEITVTGSYAFANIVNNIGFMMALLCALLIASRLSGWDLNDKTINYEIVYGHKRSIIYWSRTLLSLVFGTVISWLVMMLPTIVFTLMNGFGDSVLKEEVILRSMLSFLPIIRAIAIYNTLSIAIGNSWAALVFGYLLTALELMPEVITEKSSVFTATMNLELLVTFKNTSTELSDGKMLLTFTDRLSGNDVLMTIVVSSVVTAVMLAVGHMILAKRDMK